MKTIISQPDNDTLFFFQFIFTWLGKQIYVSPSYEQVFDELLASSESNLTKELHMLNEFGFRLRSINLDFMML